MQPWSLHSMRPNLVIHFAWNYKELANPLPGLCVTGLGGNSNPQPSDHSSQISLLEPFTQCTLTIQN